PGESDPGEKRWSLTVRRPLLTLQRIAQGRAPFGGRMEDAAFRTPRRQLNFGCANQPELRQLLERVIHLWPRNARPLAYLTTFQLCIGLVAVHRPLREQAEEHKVGSRQIALSSGRHHLPCACGSSATIGAAQSADSGSSLALQLPEIRPG